MKKKFSSNLRYFTLNILAFLPINKRDSFHWFYLDEVKKMLIGNIFKFIAIFQFIFIVPNFIYAACETIDLRKPGFSMKNVEVRNQGSLGICYANSSVKAFESKLKSSGYVEADFHASIIATAVLFSTTTSSIVEFSGSRGAVSNYVCNVLEARDFCLAINF